jgi:gamma-glutamylcyclotransferase (GGCT)/AIG2-like uncharacterized protein YtfP
MISSRLERRDSLLFVYGTLRAFVDIPMARWLRRVAFAVGAAKTRGRLYDLGSYPGLKPAHASGDWVVGELYRVAEPRFLRALDRYEAGGSLARPCFRRERCLVRLARGGVRQAWVYRYRRSVACHSWIASGDYRRHVGSAAAR